MRLLPALLLPLSLLLAACAGNPHYDPARAHHAPDGFRNNYPHAAPGLLQFLRWRRDRLFGPDTPPPALSLDPVPPRLDYLHGNRGDTAITFIGHATLLVQVAGLNVLTDPQFSARASPVSFAGPRRHQPPGVALAELPRIDVVIVSHSHYDHLDIASLRALCAQPGGPPRLLLPLGIDRWLARAVPACRGATVEALDWWEARDIGPLRFVLTPVQHWSARTPFDRNATLWGGWALLADDFRFWFSGDLGYSQDIADVGARLGPFDVTAIAVGAYEPRWFMRTQHVNPAESVRALAELRATQGVGIHWGTFHGMTDEPLDQPVHDLAAALAAAGQPPERLLLLQHGETRRWDGTALVAP